MTQNIDRCSNRKIKMSVSIFDRNDYMKTNKFRGPFSFPFKFKENYNF